jgi:hypothetical protein
LALENQSGPNWTRTQRLIVAVLALIAIAALGAATLIAMRSANRGHESKLTSKTSHSPSRTPTPTPVAVTAQKPLKVQSSAPGDERKLFKTGPSPDWDVEWSYDCTKRGSGLFLVTVYDAAGHTSKNTPPIIQSGKSGSGTQHYHQAGTYFLGVRSECVWHLAVKAPTPTPSPASSPAPQAH